MFKPVRAAFVLPASLCYRPVALINLFHHVKLLNCEQESNFNPSNLKPTSDATDCSIIFVTISLSAGNCLSMQMQLFMY